MTLAELAAKGIGQLAAPPEKPHTTVYVGKIASTIEDEFLRALLEVGDLCTFSFPVVSFLFSR